MSNKAGGWTDRLLDAGGVVVTSISTAGLILVGYLTFTGGEADAHVELESAKIEAQAEDRRTASQERTEICKEFLEYLQDESPREPQSDAERLAIEQMIVQNSEQCTISSDETVNSSSQPVEETETDR